MISLITEEILAYTETLAIEGVTCPEVLIWQEPQLAAALGISQNAATELQLPALLQDNIRIVRRQSGGGAVILSPEVLCFEVIAPLGTTENLSIRESFRVYTQPLCRILKRHGLNASSSGISDITVITGNTPRKIAGCAQLRKKKAMVIHASILINLNKTLLEKYLRFPSDVPQYRQNRSHTDFCLNLSEVIPDLTPQQLSTELQSEFTRVGWNIIDQLPQERPRLTEELLRKKYSRPSWNIERKRPQINN